MCRIGQGDGSDEDGAAGPIGEVDRFGFFLLA